MPVEFDTKQIPELDLLAAEEATTGTLLEVHDTGQPVGEQSRAMTLVSVAFAAITLMDQDTRDEFITLLTNSLPIRVVDTLAEMKALPSSDSRKMVFIRQPESGDIPRTFAYEIAATDEANDISIVEPDDGIGRYFQYNI